MIPEHVSASPLAICIIDCSLMRIVDCEETLIDLAQPRRDPNPAACILPSEGLEISSSLKRIVCKADARSYESATQFPQQTAAA
jgi:hypothetical protein